MKHSDYTCDQHEIIVAFVELIKERRKTLDLSVRELGAKADVSYTVIYDLENKNILPKLETINKLANALDLLIDIKPQRTAKQPLLSLCYYTQEQAYSMEELLYDRYKFAKTDLSEQLKNILIKKGLYSKDIEEVENFIKFKLSQHKN